jgi:hypothetical protein
VLGATATAARRLLGDGNNPGTADLGVSTLALYRGDVLQAAGEGDWVTPHRTRLEEAGIKLLETQFAARLPLGELGDVKCGDVCRTRGRQDQ